MLKKSLLLSIAGVFLAVLFVLTGCQNPADPPVVNEGNTDITFPEQSPTQVDVTIKNPESVPALPEGFTYPDGAAKVLAGNATDIALAFNGGILVADTSDATGGTVVDDSAPGTGYAYVQDGVDQIIWTGPGNRGINGSSAPFYNLGSISVPPGKTLFIAAPLTLAKAAGAAGNSQWFESIAVSDQGGYLADSPVSGSVLKSGTGGAPVAPGGQPGKIVVLAGGAIVYESGSNTNPSFTLGGELEIHRGALVNLLRAGTATGLPSFVTTQGSKTVVYGELITDLTNAFNGTLDIKAGGKVNTDADVGGLTFGGDVTVAGTLTLPGSGNVIFDGNLTVAEGVTFELESSNTTTFNKKAAFYGYLNLASATYAVGPNGHLSIEKGGAMGGGAWVGNSTHLKNAFKAEKPGDDNNRVTIAELSDGAVKLGLIVTAANYTDLVDLAGNDKLNLTSITYTIDSSITASKLTVAKGNSVTITSSSIPADDELPDVEVQDGGALTLSGVLARAGTITVAGSGRALSTVGPFSLTAVGSPLTADTATFATKLTALNIGDVSGTRTVVSLPDATLASSLFEGSAITVNKNAVLYLDADTVVDPPGTITLEEGDTSYSGGLLAFDTTISTAAATFARLKNLVIGKGAAFYGRDGSTLSTTGPAGGAAIDTISFAGINTLTVHGLLDIPSTALSFVNLQNTSGGGDDVKGDGIAKFSSYAISGINSNGHAFDQLLAIRDLTVASLANVEKTSGFDKATVTPDKGTPPTSAGPVILRVNGAIALTDGTTSINTFTVDRNLDLATGSSVITLANNKDLIIGAGAGIYSGSSETPVLGGSLGTATQAEVVLRAGGATTLTGGTAGEISVGASELTLRITAADTAAKTLLIPGKLNLGASTALNAGTTTGGIKLAGAALVSSSSVAYLKAASVTASTLDADGQSTGKIALEKTGILANATSSTVGVKTLGTVYPKTGSSITLSEGAKIIGTAATLALGSSASIGIGTLTAEAAVTIEASTIDVSGTPTNFTKISGDFKLEGGASPLTLSASAGNRLEIVDTAKLISATSQYDSAAVKAITFDGISGGGATFVGTGTAVTITIAGKSTGGTLTTAGAGKLVFGAAAELSSGGLAQTLANYDATASTGGITGTLALTGSSTLTLTGELLVGTATDSGSISVGAGSKAKISLPSSSEKITLAALTGTFKGSLTFNGFTLAGVASGGPVGSDTTATAYTGSTAALVLEPNDVAGAFGRNSTGTVTATAASAVTGSTAISIAGVSSGSTTITASSRLYSTN